MIPLFRPWQDNKPTNQEMATAESATKIEKKNSLSLNDKKKRITWQLAEEAQIRGNSLKNVASSRSDVQKFELKSILQKQGTTMKVFKSEEILVEKFAELYGKRDDGGDVTMYCGRNHDVLKGHRYVLAFGSGYFREAMEVAPCEHPIVIVKNVNGDVMGKILEYLYLGQVTLKSGAELEEFLSAAKYLKVIGIENEQYVLTK